MEPSKVYLLLLKKGTFAFINWHHQSQKLFTLQTSCQKRVANFLSAEPSHSYIIRSQHFLQFSAPHTLNLSHLQSYRKRNFIETKPLPATFSLQSIVFHLYRSTCSISSRCSISCKRPILPLCHLSAALFTSNFTFLALSVIFLSALLLNSLFPLPPLSLSLLPLSSVPRGYYLSRRQICPIINLISSFSFSQSLQLPRSSPQFHRHTEAKAGKTPFLS